MQSISASLLNMMGSAVKLVSKRVKNNQILDSNRVMLDSLDLEIVDELLDDANASSSDIARKYGVPLSTVQRRRTKLERTLLIKDYSINTQMHNWRSGEIFVKVDG